jgi:hypothetical protein
VCESGCGVALYAPRRWHCCRPACLLGYVLDRCINFSLLEQSTLHRPTLLLCYHCHRCPYGGAAYVFALMLLFWSVQTNNKMAPALVPHPSPLCTLPMSLQPYEGGGSEGENAYQIYSIPLGGGRGDRICCHIRGVV